jgi:hypothetical protein
MPRPVGGAFCVIFVKPHTSPSPHEGKEILHPSPLEGEGEGEGALLMNSLVSGCPPEL